MLITSAIADAGGAAGFGREMAVTGPRLHDEQRVRAAAAGDRPLDVLVAAEVALDAAPELDEARERRRVQARHVAQLLGHVDRAPRRGARSSGTYCTSLWLTCSRTTSPVTLLTRKSSGVTSPPTTARPRPQLALIATTLGSPFSGLHVNITPDTAASTISWTVTPIAGACDGEARAEPGS